MSEYPLESAQKPTSVSHRHHGRSQAGFRAEKGRGENDCGVLCRLETEENAQGVPALVTFVTAGYPRIEDTVPILLAMQAGGADIVELGIPFSDPIADGPSIQETNSVRDQESYSLTRLIVLPARLLSATKSTMQHVLDF